MEIIPGFVKALAIGIAVGFLLGWFVKKAIKVVLFIAIGLALAGVVGLYQGWFKSEWVTWVSVPEFSMPGTTGLETITSLFLANLPFGAAAVVAFFVGLKKG